MLYYLLGTYYSIIYVITSFTLSDILIANKSIAWDTFIYLF